jgi:hypothetical protein
MLAALDDRRGAMPAGIHERPDFTVGAPHDDERKAVDVRGEEISSVWNVGC